MHVSLNFNIASSKPRVRLYCTLTHLDNHAQINYCITMLSYFHALYRGTSPGNIMLPGDCKIHRSIAPSLTKLISLSLQLPEWKCARITPIFLLFLYVLTPVFKKNIIVSPPLPVVSKLLEQHIHSLVSKYHVDNSPISNFQWGFMPPHLTILALCSLTHE